MIQAPSLKRARSFASPRSSRGALRRSCNQDRFTSSTSDVITVPYAPHELVFPFARAIVHQGGIGTLAEALLAGKPMLIMPYAHDQADNACARTASVLPESLRVVGTDRGSSVASWDGYSSTRAQFAAVSVARKVSQEQGVESAADLIEVALAVGNRLYECPPRVYVHIRWASSAIMAMTAGRRSNRVTPLGVEGHRERDGACWRVTQT